MFLKVTKKRTVRQMTLRSAIRLVFKKKKKVSGEEMGWTSPQVPKRDESMQTAWRKGQTLGAPTTFPASKLKVLARLGYYSV